MVPLNVLCPHCKADLMDRKNPLDGHPSIRLRLQFEGSRTMLRLSAIYGSFGYKTDVNVEGGDVTDLLCPACEKSVVTSIRCDVCSAPLARLKLAVDGEVYFCSRRGCMNHKVELRDLERSLIELYRNLREEA